MNGSLLLQLHLLEHMRATDLVASAVTTLGVTATERQRAREAWVAHGLEQVGHPMHLYRMLLGPPLVEQVIDDVDPYRAIAWHYALPLWPHLRFIVQGSVQGQTGGLSFRSHSSAQALRQDGLSALVPWRVTSDSVAGLLTTARLTDEWYPQKDYECTLQDRDGNSAPLLLRFDYDLLQSATLIKQSAAQSQKPITDA